MGLRWATAGCLGIAMLLAAACDPLTGTGPGTPPDPKTYIHSDSATRAVVITLIAGYPAGDYQFNYNGYGNGTLVITIPIGWQATVQCENRGTVPNSCAVVRGKTDIAPMQPGWSTPDPTRGLDPGRSGSFVFSPSTPGSFGIAVSIGFGVLHSAGHPDIGYLTAMDFHVGAAICVIPFLLWHVVARPLKLRVTDLDRRAFLKGGLVTVGAALGVALMPAARRAPTGSFQAADPVATVWMFDSVPVVDVATWRLAVPGREWTYAELVGYTDRTSAVIDCTGGWYSEQVWEGVLLERLLGRAGGGASSVNVRSITGYSRRFALGDAGRMLLATDRKS